MSLVAVALAVLNAGRPAGIAATYALLSAPGARRLLLAYVCVGFAWSAGIGVLVVSVLGGIDVGTGEGPVNELVDLLGGVALLGFGAGVWSGRIGANRGAVAPEAPSPLERRLREPSLAIAAAAGIVTHLPGLLYLLGLNAILDADPGVTDGAIAVLVFNAIWFAIPVSALALSIRRPDRTRAALGRLTSWGRAHGRTLVAVVSALVGAWFTIRGGAALLD